MNTTRRILAVSAALTAGLFLTGCDDPENEDTQGPAGTSIQQDEEGADDRGEDGEGGGEEGGEQGGDDD
jgi:hypothetical protein